MKKSVKSSIACVVAALFAFVAFAVCPEGMEGMGLAIWLDATDIDGMGDGNPGENTAVNSWKDKATGLTFTPIVNNYTADQYLPHVYSNGRAGKDVVSFGRANAINQSQYLGVNDSRIATLFDNTNTAFVVAQSSLGGADNNTQKTTYFFARKGNHSGFGPWGYPLATAIQSTRWFGGTGGANNCTQPMAPYTNGKWVAASRIIRGSTTTSGTSTEIFINNQLSAASTNENVSIWGHSGNANIMYLGFSGTQGNNHSGGFSGYMAEVLVFNRELDAEERAKVWEYLNARWQLSGADEYTYDDGVIRSNDDSVKRTNLGGGRILYEFSTARGDINVKPVAPLTIERALLVGGGGAGGSTLGGGGAGGGVVEINDVASDLINEFTISVGEGGVSPHLRNIGSSLWSIKGGNGCATTLRIDGNDYIAYGGGGGASWSANTAESTSAAAPLANAGGGAGSGGKGGTGIDHNGADVVTFAISNGNGAGGGAGAGGNGQAAYQDGSAYYAGNGGVGVTNDITGVELEYGAGGGGGGGNKIHRGVAGGESGGNGGEASDFGGPQLGFDGLDGRGGGAGGGGYAASCSGGNGGSGAVLLVVLEGDISIADSFDKYPLATASGEIVFTYIRNTPEAGSTYLVSLEGDSSQLPSEGWTACGDDLPTFQIPVNTPYGNVTVYYHVKSPDGTITTASADILYVAPATSVPMVTTKNAIVTYDESIGGITPITVGMVKDSVTDQYGIFSETLDVDGICTPTTNTTLIVTNRLGLSASSTATVTASPLSFYVSPDGDDDTATGWSSSPFKTITNAVALAAAGYAADYHTRTVCLMEGTFSASEGQGFPITITEGIDLKGAGMGVSVIDAEGTANILSVSDAAVKHDFSGFSLRNVASQFFAAGKVDFAMKDVEMSGCTTGQNCLDVNTRATSHAVSFENLVMTNITVTVQSYQLIHCGGSGAISFDKCYFADIRLRNTGNATGIKICYAQSNGADHFYTAGWPATITDCVFENWSYAGFNNNQESGVIVLANPAGTHIIDRCVFRDMSISNNQRGVLISPNRASSNFLVRNCLFENVERVVFNAFQTYTQVRNCTIHNCGSVFWPSSTLQAYNCSVSSCDKLCEGTASGLYIRNSNVYDTTYAGQYNADNSDEPTTFDPYYKNAAAGNFNLKALSKLVDLGNNSYASGDYDFAGNARIIDGGCGTATIDVGCLEYDPDAAGAGIKFEATNYGIFEDRSLTLRAKVDPAPDGTLTANVNYPDGLFGPATIALGGDWTSFVITAANEFEQADGTVVELTVTDPAGELEEGSVGITLYNRIVTVSDYQPRIFLRNGEQVFLRMQLPSAEFGAPGTIGVTADTLGGEGTSSIVWAGKGFANGANAADQTIALTGGLGSNTLTLTLDNGFTFAETGTDAIAVEVVGFASPLFVDPVNGSDETGIGTADAPLASLNYALEQLRSGEQVAAMAGLYTTVANGGHEAAFPIIVPNGITIVGVRGTADDATDSTVVDPNNTGRAFVLGTLGGDPGTVADGALKNVVIRHSNGVAIHGRFWKGAIENCHLENLSGNYSGTVAAYFENDKGDIAFTDVEVNGIDSTSIRAIYVASGTGGSSFTRCHFHGLNFSPRDPGMAGTVESRRPMLVDHCLFEDNTIAPYGNCGESWGMIYAFKQDGSGWPNDGEIKIKDTIVRNCDLSCAAVMANRNQLDVIDSLFHDLRGSQVFSSFRAAIVVRNCTIDNVNNLFFLNPSHSSHASYLYNTSVSRAASFNVSGANYFSHTVKNSNLYDVGEGAGYSTNLSANVTAFAPSFKDAENGDYHLKSSSELKDAGDNTLIGSAVDLDGNARIFRAEKGGIVDIGCYECSILGGTVFLLR